MVSPPPIDQITERVERLLARHAELQHANALLTSQVLALTQERDSLRSRLNTARMRVDALLEKLPPDADDAPDAPTDLPKDA
ncbi:DUF904 domain-containing protein [Acidovorax sp. GBBC 3334]|uniref:DUF904 domain-containing protein n=1 Tax=Acidovorax sp. GBBC 3334 TaxID=2940496 RepID=UPI0023028CE9|nr:DUF904 domain-containing protein [Acidovorax sp. GBBC 3334]MDA8454202.1 DUF904 domain-containing protein [Acidovorax sp. GBBC 3334]